MLAKPVPVATKADFVAENAAAPVPIIVQTPFILKSEPERSFTVQSKIEDEFYKMMMSNQQSLQAEPPKPVVEQPVQSETKPLSIYKRNLQKLDALNESFDTQEESEAAKKKNDDLTKKY